jgi:hypothetical protein
MKPEGYSTISPYLGTVSSGGKIDKPGGLEYDAKVEPADVEVSAFNALVRHDDRVKVLNVHVESPSLSKGSSS